MTVRWGEVFSSQTDVKFAATCDNCGSLSVGEGRHLDTRYNANTDLGNVRRAVADAEGAEKLEWWPKAGTAPAVEDVPASIARAGERPIRPRASGITWPPS